MLTAPPGFRGAFRADDDARAVYAEAAGIGRIRPRAVAVPADAADAATLVRWAHATRTPLVPRGSGSSMASGAIGTGIIVDLSRLRAIGEVDRVHRRIRVGPGALRDDVERAARAVGLRFPPDPSSGAFATIGGMIATNAAGAHTLRFGATRAWVASVDCIFDDGSCATLTRGIEAPHGIPALDRVRAVAHELRTREAAQATTHAGVRKDSSGYGVRPFAASGDVIDLVIGSEGTLVLVVGAELVLDEAARATSSLLGAFPTLEGAVIGATRARDAGAVACELLDRTFLDVAARGETLHGIPARTEGVLLAEVEGESDDDAANAARALADAFRAAGASEVTLALTGRAETELWELRHAASPILATLGPSLTSMQFIEDSAVPPSALPAYVRGVRDAFARYGIQGVIFGHAGDSHVHVNPLVDVESPGWRETVRALLDDVAGLVAQLGGTLDGEHGDGRLRTPLLPRVWSAEAMRLFRLVKDAFDPEGIFNPGVKLPVAGEEPIGDIKYDPALAPLPPRARAALDAVARDRAYHRFRLDLLDAPPAA